jgi:hypothetical protein
LEANKNFDSNHVVSILREAKFAEYCRCWVFLFPAKEPDFQSWISVKAAQDTLIGPLRNAEMGLVVISAKESIPNILRHIGII